MGERPLGAGRAAAPADKTIFLVEAFARADGRKLWERRLDAEGALTPTHEKHNLATPSPVTDGTLVYALFGTGQLAALNRDGSVAWHAISARSIGIRHSVGARQLAGALRRQPDPALRSPVGVVSRRARQAHGQGKVEGGPRQGPLSYSTPLIVETPNGTELIVNSSERIDAYDPRNGTPLWHTGEANRFPVPSPVVQTASSMRAAAIAAGPTWPSSPAAAAT